MIAEIVANEPKPVPQSGESTTFDRRTPADSLLFKAGAIEDLYDQIRMLDAATYPHAFLEHGQFRLEFHDANISDGQVEARVKIRFRS